MPQCIEHKTVSLLPKENKQTHTHTRGGYTINTETFWTVSQVVQWQFWFTVPVQQQQISQASSFPVSRKALGHIMEKGMFPRDYVSCWEMCLGPWLWPATE